MEENFRNTLIIISAVVIGAFFVHGIWTIRKNKNPYKLKTKAKTKKEKMANQARDFDGSGFDQDGVGQIKVKTKAEKETLSPAPTSSDTPIEDLLGKAMAAEAEEPNMPSFSAGSASDPSISALSEQNNSVNNEPLNNPELESILKAAEQSSSKLTLSSEPELKPNLEPKPKPKISKPLYQEPVIQPKPNVKVRPKAIGKELSKAALKRNQIEINFGIPPELDDEKVPNITLNEPSKSAIQPEVLSLSVVMPANQIIHGAALLPSLLTLGLKYGEMNIFHRHQDNAGNGAVTFSLANMMNPGSFDLDTMETFATQGITLFMMLPNTGNAFGVYQQMLAAAKQLSQEFQAQVLDDKRNVMTKQTEQHYVSRIREFEIKNRAAAV